MTKSQSSTILSQPWCSWRLPVLCAILLLVTGSGKAFGVGHAEKPKRQRPSTILSYASTDPMAQAGQTLAQGGGCPFMPSKVDKKMWDVPALFNDKDDRPIVLVDVGDDIANPADMLRNNKIVRRLLKFDSCRKDSRGNLRFAPLQSRVGDLLCQRMSEELRKEAIVASSDDKSKSYSQGSIIVCAPSETCIKSNAALFVGRSLGGLQKPLRYLSLFAYAFPINFRDRIHSSILSVRRKLSFGRKGSTSRSTGDKDQNDRFEERFVDDSILLGGVSPNERLPVPEKGDKVRVIWPEAAGPGAPSITYNDDHPNGLCLVGAKGTVTTVDLPHRIVMKIERDSLGLKPDIWGANLMYTWTRPSEVAIVEAKSTLTGPSEDGASSSLEA